MLCIPIMNTICMCYSLKLKKMYYLSLELVQYHLKDLLVRCVYGGGRVTHEGNKNGKKSTTCERRQNKTSNRQHEKQDVLLRQTERVVVRTVQKVIVVLLLLKSAIGKALHLKTQTMGVVDCLISTKYSCSSYKMQYIYIYLILASCTHTFC